MPDSPRQSKMKKAQESVSCHPTGGASRIALEVGWQRRAHAIMQYTQILNSRELSNVKDITFHGHLSLLNP